MEVLCQPHGKLGGGGEGDVGDVNEREGSWEGGEGKHRGTTEYKTFNVCRILQRSHPFSPWLSPPPPATVRRPAGQHAGLPRSQDAAAPPGPQQQRAHLALLAEERQDLHQPHHSSQGTSLRPARVWNSSGHLTLTKPRWESRPDEVAAFTPAVLLQSVLGSASSRPSICEALTRPSLALTRTLWTWLPWISPFKASNLRNTWLLFFFFFFAIKKSLS